MVDRRCENCAFWDTACSIGDDFFRCRVNAPVVDMRSGHAQWPHTEAEDWCGQFVPSAEALADEQDELADTAQQ